MIDGMARGEGAAAGGVAHAVGGASKGVTRGTAIRGVFITMTDGEMRKMLLYSICIVFHFFGG